jgi:hypothetical protein
MSAEEARTEGTVVTEELKTSCDVRALAAPSARGELGTFTAWWVRGSGLGFRMRNVVGEASRFASFKPEQSGRLTFGRAALRHAEDTVHHGRGVAAPAFTKPSPNVKPDRVALLRSTPKNPFASFFANSSLCVFCNALPPCSRRRPSIPCRRNQERDLLPTVSTVNLKIVIKCEDQALWIQL